MLTSIRERTKNENDSSRHRKCYSISVLNYTMLIVRYNVFFRKNSSIDRNKSSRTFSIESFNTRNKIKIKYKDKIKIKFR